MSRIEEIKAEIKPLIEELNRLEVEQRELELKDLLGRCFKYHNSYSLPKSDADRWWIYRRINSVDDGILTATSFQIDVNGKIEIEASDAFSSITGWEEISYSEYQKAWADNLSIVSSIKI